MTRLTRSNRIIWSDGYVDWERAEAIRRMVSENVPTSRHHGAAATVICDLG
jgi:hypothetical protein